ncbi:amidohydrolase family protein [Stieleria sp. TO1_6]|uniref:amidohydrolase family protein n=1 Tax=Stieleria tagensis TaxID=2956795 RepID=UPI00209ACD5D|nr:amidohydrolase family protein [Stieleria tagensis]MCO8125226.1 amidohydrolase family protein [Stieleria tagensis]
MSPANIWRQCGLAVAICLSGSTNAPAHDQIPGAPQTRPIAIVGGTIHRVDAAPINQGAVLFTDGVIQACGKNLTLPENCVTIDATGKHVYPGLIESISSIGLVEVNSVRGSVDTHEIGDENGNLQPWVAVNPDSELIPVARAGGVLLAAIAPDGGKIRGQTSVIQLDGWTADDMLLTGTAGIMVSWRSYDSREGDDQKRATERDRKLSELADRLDQAKRYAATRTSTSADDQTDLRLAALVPVVAGQMPLIVQADRRREIESAVAFAASRGIRIVIYGGYDAPQCAEMLKKYDVPVIVHSTYRLPLRRDDPYDHPYTLPARLHAAGIAFAIGGPGSGSPAGPSQARNLPYHAAVAAAHGLSREQAIRSITLSPAEILGVDDRVGSITVGKDATLIVVDGDVLLTESNVTAAYIGGREVDLGNRHQTLAEKYKLKYKRQQQAGKTNP